MRILHHDVSEPQEGFDQIDCPACGTSVRVAPGPHARERAATNCPACHRRALPARSAAAQGKSTYKPNAPPGKVWPDWETNQHKKMLRIIEQTKTSTCACSICNSEFTPKRSDAKTCSSACRQAAYRLRLAQAAA